MTTNTLHVEAAQTETSPGEFVTDGFKVTFNGEAVYVSRSPLKAVIKAVILTTDERFAGATLTFGDGVPEAAGKLNLALTIDAGRFQAMRELAMGETGEIVEAFVGHVKEHSNHIADPEQTPESE